MSVRDFFIYGLHITYYHLWLEANYMMSIGLYERGRLMLESVVTREDIQTKYLLGVWE